MTSTAPPISSQAGRALARERLAARRSRTLRIRKRVAAAGAALFLAVFGGIYVQMATGNDPLLAAKKTTAAVTVASTSGSEATTTSADTTTATTASSDTSSSSGSTASSNSSTTTTAPVTTSQS